MGKNKRTRVSTKSKGLFSVFFIADDVKGKMDLKVRLQTLQLDSKEYLDQTVHICVTDEKLSIPPPTAVLDSFKESNSTSSNKSRYTSSRARRLVPANLRDRRVRRHKCPLVESARKLKVPVWNSKQLHKWLRTREKKAGITEHSSVDIASDYGPCKFARMIIEDLTGHFNPMIKIFKPDALGNSTVPKFYPDAPKNFSFFSHPWERVLAPSRYSSKYSKGAAASVVRSSSGTSAIQEEAAVASLGKQNVSEAAKICEGGCRREDLFEAIVKEKNVQKKQVEEKNVQKKQSVHKYISIDNKKGDDGPKTPSFLIRKKTHTKEKSRQIQGGGYCECCRTHYKDLAVHTATKKHMNFENDPRNYATLDSIIRDFRTCAKRECKGIYRLIHDANVAAAGKREKEKEKNVNGKSLSQDSPDTVSKVVHISTKNKCDDVIMKDKPNSDKKNCDDVIMKDMPNGEKENFQNSSRQCSDFTFIHPNKENRLNNKNHIVQNVESNGRGTPRSTLSMVVDAVHNSFQNCWNLLSPVVTGKKGNISSIKEYSLLTENNETSQSSMKTPASNNHLKRKKSWKLCKANPKCHREKPCDCGSHSKKSLIRLSISKTRKKKKRYNQTKDTNNSEIRNIHSVEKSKKRNRENCSIDEQNTFKSLGCKKRKISNNTQTTISNIKNNTTINSIKYFECDKNCGYVGEFQDVCAHEKVCMNFTLYETKNNMPCIKSTS